MLETFNAASTATTIEHDSQGMHLLASFKRCAPEILHDADKLQALAYEAATATGATIMQVGIQNFHPQGLTIFIVLGESHASLHTYPETGVVFWDCFTCGTTCKPELSLPILIEKLQPKIVEQNLVPRGHF